MLDKPIQHNLHIMSLYNTTSKLWVYMTHLALTLPNWSWSSNIGLLCFIFCCCSQFQCGCSQEITHQLPWALQVNENVKANVWPVLINLYKHAFHMHDAMLWKVTFCHTECDSVLSIPSDGDLKWAIDDSNHICMLFYDWLNVTCLKGPVFCLLPWATSTMKLYK